MNKKMIFFLLFILISIVGAKEFTNFTNNRQDGNLTYLGDENKTLYVTIPSDSNVTNFSLILEGLRGPVVERLNITNITNMIGNFSNSFCTGSNDTYIYLRKELCYQESANESTIGDGVCGLDYSGSYSSVATSGSSRSIDINYTKPINSTQDSLWSVKYGRDVTSPFLTNFSIPLDCWNRNESILSLRANSKYFFWRVELYCLNSTGWHILNSTITYSSGTSGGTIGDGFKLLVDGDWDTGSGHSFDLGWLLNPSGGLLWSTIYEEAMYWDYGVLSNYSLNNSYFTTGTNLSSNDSIYLEFYGEEDGCELDFDEGDYLQIFYNDGQQLNITFPDITLSATSGSYSIGLYPTTDGSTFYDGDLTNFSALALNPLGNYSEGYYLSLGSHTDGHIDRDYNDTFNGINKTDLSVIAQNYINTQSNNVSISLLINSNTTGTIRYYLENLTYYTLPTVYNVTINPSPALATQSLNCTYNYADNESLTEQSRTFYWFVNGALNYTTNSFVNFSDNNFSAGDKIICGVKASHEFGESYVVNSSELTIADFDSPYYLGISYTNSLTTTGTQTISVDVADSASNMDFARLSYTSPTGTNSNVSMTKVNNTQFTLSFLTPTAGAWTIDEVYYSDSSGNTNDTVLSESFTVTAITPGGGAGGGEPELSELGEPCVSNSDCSSLLCDTMVTKTCVETLCGNGYCDKQAGETYELCSIDCSTVAQVSLGDYPWLINGALLFFGIFFILKIEPKTWEKLKRKVGGRR